ncbi:hypothetical protein [Puniceibacterium sediminis]|nr:hypothetical protein [Puniceibacterium sediminis]
MTDVACNTPLGCPVPPNSALTAEQSIDAFEAVCDALFRAFRCDYKHFCAATSAARVECHAEAYNAWHTVHVALTNFATIKSLPPILIAVSDQFSKLLKARLSDTFDSTLDGRILTRAAIVLRSKPEHDVRLADLLTDAAGYILYNRQPGISVPVISDLLDDI